MTNGVTTPEFLVGSGGMAALIREKDWSATPLGPVEAWPQSLRTTVSLCLASNFPINIIWGPAHTQIYNDGYRLLCGDSHPRALGEGYDVTWASAWPAIGGPFARALAGETTFLENQRMFLARNGYLEETFFTFSTSPIRDESGGIGGLFHPVTETTAAMLAERRMRALRDAAASFASAADAEELAGLAASTLAAFAFDLPFVLLYVLSPDGAEYRLAARTGLASGTSVSPETFAADATAPWPVVEASAGQGSINVGSIDVGSIKVGSVAALLSGTACGPYDEPPDRVVMLPVGVPGVARPPLLAVVGVSPRLPYDDAYRGFHELLAATLSAALATVRAREDERRRAEALAELDRAKTAFFSNVSHEFRTPLTLMLGPLEESLVDPDLPPAERQRVAIAHRNGRRLLRLVNSLLDFSRIEAGRVVASYEPTDLAALTADLASNFRSACERAGLSLTIDAPPLPQPVYLDHDMWEKVVLNLLSNAFKFTFEGSIRVTVHPSADGTAAEVVVADTGIGIPPGDLPRMFERFHRIEGARGRSSEGSGIGLAFVQELVTLHRGTIRAESRQGLGSVFTITIPFGDAHLPADRLGAATPSGVTSARASPFVEEALGWLPAEDSAGRAEAPVVPHNPGTRGRVLLADDNADMRAYVANLLHAAGFAVEAVTDGWVALAAARRDAPDLVLSDVMMPGLDGFGLLRALRGDPRLSDLPVILLSARAGEEARVEGLKAGADDYLTKPFAARELVARVSTTLNLARDRREAALRESEAELRALNADLERRVMERSGERGLIWQHSPDLLSIIDMPSATFERVNPAWTATLGWGMGEMEGKPYMDFVHDDDVAASAAAFERVQEGEPVRYRTRDGDWRWLSWVAVPEGEKLYSSARDVTAEREAGEAIARSEEALRQAQNMEAI
ncbi:MAG: putative sensor histidine kinase with multiple and a response regulator receiver domain, partial [Rubritepida sp.]|nr:putative sensor histidine kinase with multiple and a response regulator receiver domain [Rubritepida sp.]